jgi:hypothetical protein
MLDAPRMSDDYQIESEERDATPSYRLWCEVLLRAFDDLSEKHERKSAIWWFTGRNTGLEEVCAVLGVPVKVVRQKAMKNMAKPLRRGFEGASKGIKKHERSAQ